MARIQYRFYKDDEYFTYSYAVYPMGVNLLQVVREGK